jgi:DmsA/YnfE family anaerobic dimethyl sulfoxide reductase A subunit
MSTTIYEAPRAAAKPGETVVTSTCGHNCGGRCVVNAHVRDGRIVHISTDAQRWNPDHPPLPACARGVGQIERTYHPDRLKYPMRRTGPRGSGQYERISWDEALDTVAQEMLRVRETYGNAAILDASRTGSQSMLHGRVAAQRFLYMFGGCTDLWSNMSAEAEVFAVRITYGEKDYKSAGREPTDFVNSKLILMWGWSPGDGTFGTGTMQYLKHAKQNGTRIVCVDPRVTMTSKQLADEHVFIRPSTDAAALIAMAYVIVSENLHDQAYCDRYVLGLDEGPVPPRGRHQTMAGEVSWTDEPFITSSSPGSTRRSPPTPVSGAIPGSSPGDDEKRKLAPIRLDPDAYAVPPGASYRSYLLGLSDGQPKTPEWAAAITGIPAETIRRLATEFAAAKPAAIQAGYAAGRTVFGEQFHRAAYALAAITGNVGISGGNSGVSNGATGRAGIKSLPTGKNPIEAKVSSPLLADLLARGKAGGYPADIRMIYSSGGDLFNQCPNAGKIVASLDKVEFIVAQDHFLTPTARFADIVLPATTFWERNDVHTPWAGAGHYAIYMRQAIEPMYECRNDIDIFDALSRRVGINSYNDKSETQWLKDLTAGAVDDFQAFTEQGVARFAAPADAVAFAGQIRDHKKFQTPSGKIEIYSTVLAANPNPYGLGVIPPIPTWLAPDDDVQRFPLSLCTPKSRARTHSIHGNQPGLARVDPDTVWMHPDDAAARGIIDGQRVLVFNDIGATMLPAEVTDRIAPGVVSIKEGAWFAPGSDGVDTQGSANVLTTDRSAPCGATTYNTNQVQIEAAP